MIEYILLFVGLALLMKGADFLVDGSSSLAKKLGVSTLVIGLTVVAFGTSMPELVVNIAATLQGANDVSMGNIIGSNIANILLILGVSTIIVNLKVQQSTIWREIPLALLAALALLVSYGKKYTDSAAPVLLRSEGILFLLFFVIFLIYVLTLAKNSKADNDDIKTFSNARTAVMIIGGLAALFIGGRWTVEGAIYLARQIGLSEYFISATIVAVGTSLPELVTSVVAALKKNYDLSVGNIVGSNIFNIFFILGITSLISPVQFISSAGVDLLFMVFVTLLLFLFMFIGRKHELKRWQGVVFLLLYVGYVGMLILRG